MKRWLCAVILGSLLIFSAASCEKEPAQKTDSQPVTAILGAFHREISLLKDNLEAPRETTIEGMPFIRGRLGGSEVAIAWTGVGKVNAAMVTTLMIEHFQPAQLIFTGIAGAVDPNLEPGDIVLGERVAHHDMGYLGPERFQRNSVTNPITGEENPVFFDADASLLATAERAAKDVAWQPIETRDGTRLPRVRRGVIVTGDIFVASRAKCEELARELGADAVEMEGAAVAQVCYQQGVRCLVVRSMSDKADEDAITDKEAFYEVAGENSARLVARIMELMGATRQEATEGTE
jgi:adenosylhomocysteine nucleosidase